jgi:hypothetical protein
MTNEKGKDAPGLEDMMKKMMSMFAEHGPAMKELMAKHCSGKEGKFDCMALCERFLKGEKPCERKQATEETRP